MGTIFKYDIHNQKRFHLFWPSRLEIIMKNAAKMLSLPMLAIPFFTHPSSKKPTKC